MRTMRTGGALLVTATLAVAAFGIPALYPSEPLQAAPAQKVEKTLLLTVEGMH